MIQKKEWFDWKKGSGKLPNLGNLFYFKLAADIMREVRNARDEHRVSHCRKVMMQVEWLEGSMDSRIVRQLFPYLQFIEAEYVENFN